MKRKVVAFFPGKDFPSISVTGGRCDLQCDHCRGRHLRGMIPVSSPWELFDLARVLDARGVEGLLLSGGCDPDGRVPLEEYHEVIGRIKSETDLTVNVHTGLLDRQSAARLVQSGPDCLSVDIVQDDRVISDVLHLRSSPRAYEDTLDALFESGARSVVPHICVGLSGEEGELAALNLVSKYRISALVVLSFWPTRGTPLAPLPPPSDSRVLDFFQAALDTLSCPVLLGCMRPRGRWELEAKCVELGAAGIAMPSRRTLRWAEERGYAIETSRKCCALYR